MYTKRDTEHDNSDRDIIIINKDSQLYRFKDYISSSNGVISNLGTALTFLLAAYLTESFHNLGPIPGETVRASFIMFGMVSAGLFIRSVFGWYKTKNEYEPEKIIEGLIKTPPLLIPDITRIPSKISLSYPENKSGQIKKSSRARMHDGS
jgi:hypothetical protein